MLDSGQTMTDQVSRAEPVEGQTLVPDLRVGRVELTVDRSADA